MKFTDEHEWLTLDGAIATIGITAFASDQLGDLVFIELPKMGAKLNRGSAAAVVESVKAASDVYAPLNGEVVEINDAVGKDPSLVNSDPLGAGWLYKLKLDNRAEFDALMDEDTYKKHVRS